MPCFLAAAGTTWLATYGNSVLTVNPPGSLQFWVWESWLAVLAVVGGFLVVFAVMYDWPARLRSSGKAPRHHGQRTGQRANSPQRPAPHRPRMPHQHRAEILEFPLDRNKTRTLLR
jgi:hypothetical protein